MTLDFLKICHSIIWWLFKHNLVVDGVKISYEASNVHTKAKQISNIIPAKASLKLPIRASIIGMKCLSRCQNKQLFIAKTCANKLGNFFTNVIVIVLAFYCFCWKHYLWRVARYLKPACDKATRVSQWQLFLLVIIICLLVYLNTCANVAFNDSNVSTSK